MDKLKPLFGHTTGRQSKTMWACFIKKDFDNMDVKDLLKDLSTEDLREEIKRRNKEARATAVRKESVWHEWTAVVTQRFGEYRPVHNIGYYLKSEHVDYDNRTFYLKAGTFNKKNMPNVGDTVALSVRVVAADKGKVRYGDSKIIRIETRNEGK